MQDILGEQGYFLTENVAVSVLATFASLKSLC